MTEEDLYQLALYRREQLFTAIDRKNELAQERLLQEAGEIPEALTHEDLKFLVQYRQDQYTAVYLKANEDKFDIKEALASSSEDVKKAYAELNDALTDEDLDFLMQYRKEQYQAAVSREQELRPKDQPQNIEQILTNDNPDKSGKPDYPFQQRRSQYNPPPQYEANITNEFTKVPFSQTWQGIMQEIIKPLSSPII